jgi:hypothetical protein
MRQVVRRWAAPRQAVRRVQQRAALLGALFAAACSSADDLRLPERWAIQYKDKSVGQLIEQLGVPQESVGAKQYMNWVDPMQDGRRVLKVMCPINCDETERPTEVLFLVYRSGAINPVRSQSLL